MKRGTINDITKLKFFRDNGLLIPMQLEYTLTWELVPCYTASKYLQEIPKGYFIGDIDLYDPNNITILPDSLMVGFTNPGKVIMQFATLYGKDKNGIRVFKYNEEIKALEYYEYIRDIFQFSGNKVRVDINAKNDKYSVMFNVTDVFTFDNVENLEDYYSVNNIYTGTNIDDDYEYFLVLSFKQIDLKLMYSGDETFIQAVFERNVPNIGVFFPFVTYKGAYHQETVSENFISADTLMVLEEHNEDGEVTYERPYIDADSQYYLVFLPEKDSQINLIKKDIECEIEYVSEMSFDLAAPVSKKTIDPLYFSVAFLSDELGAYLNYLGIYMRSKNNPNVVFFMGLISIKTEVEGEDERFRTLLTNNGAPDPKYYSNLFAELEYDEECSDYTLINKKSKELMLTYEKIFSYIGTYKALMGAIKFLGYYDIIFKEWYTLKTSNDSNVDIAVLTFDTSSGLMLKQKLASYGISIEDFRNYNKINKLTMVYHLNQQSDEEELLEQRLVYYDVSTGEIKPVEDASSLTYTKISGVPMTLPLSIYRNDEIIAKLYSVKKWLERNVIGVGAYIADITGEGLYFGWQKTQGYHTLHHLNNFSLEQYYTADVKDIGKFVNSSTYISCTLTELNNAVRFEDYENYPIESFIKYEKPILLVSKEGIYADIDNVIISNSIEAPVLGDEYEFDIVLHTKEGTLDEWTIGNQEIYFSNDKIDLLNERLESCATIGKLPIITLENANIHKSYGKWESNVKWLIREIIDSETGNTKYKLKNYELSLSDSYETYCNRYFILSPDTNDAYIKYTCDNKWNIPMFVMHGYKFKNAELDSSLGVYFDMSTGDYILEIMKGDMLFKDSSLCSCKVLFSDDNLIVNQGDTKQAIDLEYTYHSERMPFVIINDSSISEDTSVIYDFSTYTLQVMQDNLAGISLTYSNLLSNLKSLLDSSNTAAYKEAEQFISTTMLSDTAEFLSYKNERLIKNLMYGKYLESYDNNYVCNSHIDVSVNRIGKYDVIAKAYDCHNNAFVSKYDNKAIVEAKPLDIDTYSYNAYSNNEKGFYKNNMNGTPMDASQIHQFKELCDLLPLFHSNYKLPNFDVEDTDATFVNMSYSIDTPKNNDYVIFENCTERCVSCTPVSAIQLKLFMLDENPNKNNLDIALNINVVVYDRLTMADVSVISCNVLSSYFVNPENDVNFSADSYIVANINDSSINANDVAALINDNKYNTYVLNTTEYALTGFSKVYNADINTTYLVSNAKKDKPLFNIGDVVKLRCYMDYDLDTSLHGRLINEVAYKINNIYAVIDGKDVDLSLVDLETYDYYNAFYKYAIIGKLPENFVENVSLVLTYAAEYPVHYVSRVNGDGKEYLYNMGYDNYYIMRDDFKYNSKYMFLNKYVDDTYSGFVSPYDPNYIKRDWKPMAEDLEGNENKTEMYYYHEFPISINEGSCISFTHNNSDLTLLSGYHVLWSVSNKVVDDTDNYDDYKTNAHKELMYRNVNDVLSFNANMLGSYDIQLECIDRYGNKLVNEGSGRLYVKLTK